jgi:predicted nucleotidyltransferase
MDDALSRLGVSDQQVADFCRRWCIERLEVFGSILRDDFDRDSDVDVLVTFGAGVSHRIADYLDMESELAALVGRHVDLVERELVETSPNWIRRRSILESARPVYAA